MAWSILTDEEFNKLYPEEYYSKRLKNESEIRGAKIVTDAIFELFNPTSVIDIGCGVAMELFHFKNKGVIVKGLDRSIYAKKHACIEEVELWDLINPYSFNKRYDICMSFDFIEHISGDFESVVLSNLIKASDTVLISVPWKVGDPLHFNEQPQSHWIEAFNKLGYKYNHNDTEILKSNMVGGRMWIVRNLQVFNKK